MKRKIYDEVDGIYYSSIEQVISELNIPRHLVILSLEKDRVVKWSGYIYRFSYCDY